MKIFLWCCFFGFGICAADATSTNIEPRNTIAQTTVERRAPTTSKHTSPATRTKATHAPTATKIQKPKATKGLTKAAKIGIAVGVSLGVLLIAASVVAFVLGKRLGRKRRVDDPTAGAGKRIQDPSPELNIPPPTPLPCPAVELPVAGSGGDTSVVEDANGWWKSPFKRAGSTRPVHPPQELPA